MVVRLFFNNEVSAVQTSVSNHRFVFSSIMKSTQFRPLCPIMRSSNVARGLRREAMSIPPSVIKKGVMCMKKRCQQVWENDGSDIPRD